MANREQHVGIDFKNSTIAINGTTTASKFLGTNSSGELEWKDGGSAGTISSTSCDLSVTGDILFCQISVTASNGTVTDTGSINMASQFPCPDDCGT